MDQIDSSRVPGPKAPQPSHDGSPEEPDDIDVGPVKYNHRVLFSKLIEISARTPRFSPIVDLDGDDVDWISDLE